MHSLRDSQAQFYAAIFDSSQAVDGVDNSRLAIYRHTIFSTLNTALISSYPVIVKLVGEGFFRFLAQQYIEQYPSLSGDLNQYGEHFFQLVQRCPEAAELPYLADIAKLEWAVQLADNAADNHLFPVEKLALIEPEHYTHLQFFLSPSVYLLGSEYPIDEIWLANQETSDSTVELTTGECYSLIYRPEHKPIVCSLTLEQWQFLSAIQQGMHFGLLCETYPQLDINSLLPYFIAQAVIVDFALALLE